jgi:hypothetical protein
MRRFAEIQLPPPPPLCHYATTPPTAFAISPLFTPFRHYAIDYAAIFAILAFSPRHCQIFSIRAAYAPPPLFRADYRLLARQISPKINHRRHAAMPLPSRYAFA